MLLTRELDYRSIVQRGILRHGWFRSTAFYACAIAVFLGLTDLVLLEKKYNLFTGGFLQATQLTATSDRAIFLTVLLVAELLMACLFSQLALLLGSWRRLSLQLVNYLFVLLYGGISFALIVVKYQILSYFGDYMSLAVMRNLGGGSLADALLYVLDESLIVVVVLVLVALTAIFAWMKLSKHWLSLELPADRSYRLRRVLLAAQCLIALLALVPVARPLPATKQYLSKVTPYAMANNLVQAAFPAGPSGLVLFMQRHYSEPVKRPVAPVNVAFGGRKDNLVLVVAESTRADVLDATVGGQFVTPNWRALGAEGVVGREYYSHTGFTTSSLKAIFRSSLGERLPLGDTLFGLLKKQGYQIVVLSGQDESFGGIAKETGMRELADIYFDAQSALGERVFSSAAPGSATLSNSRLLAEFDHIAERIDWSRPVFIYMNLQAAHFPYYHKDMPKKLMAHPLARHEISADTSKQLRETYMNAVAYSDWTTGELVKRLRQRDVYQRTLLVAAGDHGESLFDDGVLGHGMQLTDMQMHAMLVANRPVPEFGRLIGQTDMAAALLSNIGASITPLPADHSGAILQVVGDLQAPAYLGFKYGDGTRLTISQNNGEIAASWLGQPVALDQVPRGSREYREVMQLVSRWKSQ